MCGFVECECLGVWASRCLNVGARVRSCVRVFSLRLLGLRLFSRGASYEFTDVEKNAFSGFGCTWIPRTVRYGRDPSDVIGHRPTRFDRELAW